ncbi:MAG: alpha/beta hydrolase [Gammaproteobacteria bacterium]
MTDRSAGFEIAPEWVHLKHEERSQFTEVYGFAGSQGIVNLEGVRLRPAGRPSQTLVVMMHPSTSLQILPVPRALVQAGVHVLCAGNRYFRNDTPLIMEKVALDLGAYIRHAREHWGYRRVVLLGWSGGGPLSLFYQSQAERPTVTATPAGEPVDLKAAGLSPADAVIFQAANVSRATLLSQTIDPSVLDEADPDRRDPELDLYDPANPNQPPYTAAYIERYRAAQLARMRRRTAWVKEMLERLRARGGKEVERGFVTHRTMADLRFMDPAVDPNDRRPRWTHIGDPETANNGPAGLARFSTLRSWLSQWSIDDSNVNGPQAAGAITAPLLIVENSADEACPASDPGRIFAAAGSTDKTMRVIKGATHYYSGQPQQLAEAVDLVRDFIATRFGDA